MKIKMTIIRHGKTIGNEKKQYVGSTDEFLSEQGIKEIEGIIPHVNIPQYVFISPMKRCLQTKAFLFPHSLEEIVPEIKEADFGEFEGKTYEELKDKSCYQHWLDCQGETTEHKGESRSQFLERSRKGFEKILAICEENNLEDIGIVAHGGTIMAILDSYAEPKESFYHWQIENANGYKFEFETEEKKAYNIEKICEE